MLSLLPILFFGLLILGTGSLVYLAFAGPDVKKAQSRRLEAIRQRHTRATTLESQMRRVLAVRDNRLDGWFVQFVPRPELLRKRMAMTGKDWTLSQFVVAVGITAVVAGSGAIAAGLPVLLVILLAVLAGLAVPNFVINVMVQRRVKAFTARFPDAIDLLVRGLRSGLPVSETISVVASEVPGPVGAEFRSVTDKMKIGKTMDQAMQETADRLGTPEFQFFCITLSIQKETGGNLAETLSNLAEVLRKRLQMKLKIAAMSSESKASALIIGCLPFVVFGLIMFINPEYMSKFFTDERLIVAGLGGMLWMSIGAFIMRQMINFEI